MANLEQARAGVSGRAPLWRSWAATLATIAASFLGLHALSTHLSLWPLLSYALGFVCVVTATLGTSAAAPKSKRGALLVTLAAVLTLEALRRYGAVGVGASCAVLVALLSAGTLLGALVGGSIEHPGHLLFVVLVSALSDTFSVTQPQGPSAAIAQSAQMLSLLALPWPMLGTGQIAPFLGVGDVLFTSLYLAAGRAHGLPAGRTWLALGAAFFVTMLTVAATALPIPALPFLGAAMLVAHPAARRPPQRDRRRGLAVVCLMALAFGALLLRNLR